MKPTTSRSGRAQAMAALCLIIAIVSSILLVALLSGSGHARASAPLFVSGSGPLGGQLPARPHVVPTSLVISQVYGGGGNSGSPWHNDFIELFNPTTAAVDLTGWSVQYASAAGSTWQVTSPLAGSVPPGGYFLIQEAAGSGGGNPLPTPDAVGVIAMSSAAAKVALVNNSTALTCGANHTTGTCVGNPAVVDYVGYGATASDYEGSGPTGAPSNTASVTRLGDGCIDNNDNAADFAVATTITPRNSASPASPCAGGGSPTTTYTPGGVTRTSTSTPFLTATPTAGVASGVLIYMLHYTQYDTSTVGIGDEAVRLINDTPDSIFVSNWRISNGPGYIELPSPVMLPAYGKIWIANRATTFRTWFGFSPDFEYGADTDPAVPQATATTGYSFVDTGGVISLLNQGGGLEDTLVYKGGSTSAPGWSGPAVQPYLPAGQPAFTEAGQIFNRKLDQVTNLPVPDTNTKDDWAQDDDPTGSTPTPGREFDDLTAKRLLRPGWALTDPRNEDMAFTKSFTDTNVTTIFTMDPDNGFVPLHDLLVSETQAITIETYEWHNLELAQDVINAKNRGVLVQAFFDGNPCCSNLPDQETLWTAKQWENVGIPVYFWSGSPATTDDTYRYSNMHQKIIVVDRQWVVTGSDNFTYTSFPSDNKANGTAGNRGATVLTNSPSVVAYTLRMIANDTAVGRYPDLVRYPGLGTPPPGYAPTPLPDMVGYTVLKPTPLVVTETENIEIIQSPDNALRDHDSLLGLVNKAGPGDDVMVVQAYERKYWESSVTIGPNPRLETYIRAARRGANVRILLDGFFEGGDCTSNTHNPATLAYINGLGLPNLQAKLGIPTAGYPMPAGTPATTPSPTTGNIHAGRVYVSTQGGTKNYVSIASLNGSLNSSKNNREYGLQIQSNAAYTYYKDVFDVDWSRGFIPCGAATSTPTPAATATGTPPTATPTSLPCNYLVNGGFESGSLVPWTTTTPGITAQIVSTPVNGGQFAVSVTSVFTVGSGGSQGLQQNIDNILGGATYHISAAVLRSASNIASARIRVTWYPCYSQGCAGTNADMLLGNNGPTWQVISADMVAPANALSAKYKPVFYTSDGNPATIYFDNLVFDCNGNATATPPAITGTTTISPTPTTAGNTLTPTRTATPGTPAATATNTPTSVGSTPTATSTCSPGWRIVSSPNVGSMSYLSGLSIVAVDDIWAVGKSSLSGSLYQTLVQHWDGNSWNLVSSPNFGTESNSLSAIAAVSANDIWAVGAYGATDHPLILHWDGAQWAIISAPVATGALNSIAALSSDNVWAVGTTTNGSTGLTLTLHWNGTDWSRTPSPNVGGTTNVFYGLTAVSSSDIWAVGYYRNGSSSERALIEHWNGTQWRILQDPYFGTGQDYLYSVSATSATDAWAVGYFADGTGDKPLVEHWNGNLWTLIAGPDPGPNTGKRLQSVAAIAPNNVWATGSYFNGSRALTLTGHWDGSSWSVMDSPNAGTSGDHLYAMAAAGPDVLWAAGTSDGPTTTRTLIERYSVPCATSTVTPTPSGNTPTRTNTPIPSSTTVASSTPTPSACNYTFTAGTSALGGGTVDIGNHCDDCTTQIALPFPFQLYDQTFTTANVGANGFLQFVNSNTFFHSCLPAPGLRYTILAHFDDLYTNCSGCGVFTSLTGSAPNRVYYLEWRAQGFGGSYNFEVRLYEGSPSRFQVVYGDLARGGIGAVVGVQMNESNYTQYSCLMGGLSNGLKLSFVQGCPEPTHTPVVTVTPVATATPCVMNFSDVTSTDYFYTPVRYLYCRGVISGYSDGTFRPGNLTTRAQLTKIIVLAMSWPIQCPSTAHFTDVAAGNPFFCFVETSYAHGIISGYSDGTFRPDNNVTRGQLCKVVVAAAGWPLDTSGGPHFTDVLPGSPFYAYVETAYTHGIISGYDDHTFRPSNGATRGQISLIVYRAVVR